MFRPGDVISPWTGGATGRFNCQDTAQNIVETTQKIMDKFETKTHVINTDLEKKENLEL